jgi:integrase
MQQTNHIGTSSIRRTATKPLTTASISALRVGQTLADGAIRPGAGSLKVRKRATNNGMVVEWLFEWSRAGKTVRQTLGRYANDGATGLTLSQARLEAGRLQELVRGGLSPKIEREKARLTASAQEAVELEESEQSKTKSFSALLAAYVAHLRAKGKRESAYDAENIFKNHIETPFPELAAMPAAQLAPQHVVRILARLVAPDVVNPRGRTALKLRSYAAAAFQLAIGANIDPMTPKAAQVFELSLNPVAAIPATSMAAKFNRPSERTLEPIELRAFLMHLAARELDLQGLALWLQLATGGQRFKQLLRLTHEDTMSSALVIRDGKGKRAVPRIHLLPLTEEIREVVDKLKDVNPPSEKLREKTPLFSSRGAVLTLETVSSLVKEISDSMAATDPNHRPFRAGDLRRTIETILSETLRVSKHDRAQLLSHGLAGTQDRHYDKGEHRQAKLEALRSWNDYLFDLCIGSINHTP